MCRLAYIWFVIQYCAKKIMTVVYTDGLQVWKMINLSAFLVLLQKRSTNSDVLATYKHRVRDWVWIGMQQTVWTTLWSGWQMTTLQRRLRSTNRRTHSVLSSVALWLLVPTPPSFAHRHLRDFVTSLCKALTQWLRRCASLKSTCMPEVSNKQLHGIAVDQRA